MALHWMNLLPVDKYLVQSNSIINEFDQKIITLLYQPLIGAIAHSLYFALATELQKDQYSSIETTHKTLMTMMGLPLDKIYEERKKLEGIGLLNVYKKEEDDSVTYLYELQKPFSANEFFKDDVLSVYLYNRVGKHRYLQLKDRFILASVPKSEFKDKTSSFSDVYTSLHHSEISAHQTELASTLQLNHNEKLVGDHDRSYKISDETFDFGLLTAHLSNMVNSQKLLTTKVKETITKLAFVYRIDPFQMSKIVQDSLLQDDTVDVDVLRDKVKTWYRFTYSSEPPALGLRTQPIHFQTMLGKTPKNEEEEMIIYYETESPLTILENHSNGAKVSESDVKIAEMLLLDYKLLPGVANVLIDYILRIDDKKFTRAYVEKIAGQWSRNHLKTVKDAMDLAKAEYKKRFERGKDEVAPTTEKETKNWKRKPNQNIRKDRLPKWLIEEKKVEPIADDENYIKMKQQLEEKLQKLKTEKQGG